jgi:hypothetical protein
MPRISGRTAMPRKWPDSRMTRMPVFVCRAGRITVM